MTKAELETELARAREEAAQLRVLLDAVQAAAAIPRPADWSAAGYLAMRQLAVARCTEISTFLADVSQTETAIRLMRHKITPCEYETERAGAAAAV